MTASSATPLDRTRPPGAGPVRPFEFPEVLASELPNGLGLRVARRPQLPLVTLSMVFKGGESLLPDGSAGLAVLTGAALEGGTRKRTGPELAEAFEAIGASLSVQTGWDSTALTVTCLADRKAEAMALLAETVLEPAFPDPEVDRFRSQRLAAIRQRRMDPRNLADDSAVHALFSESVPYHRPLAGTQSSVEGIGRREIMDFWRRRFLPRGSGLVVVGDVDVGEVEGLAGSAFGGWEGEPEGAEPIVSQPRSRIRRVVVVDRPGAVQSEIRIGQVGVPRSTPHYFPLQVFNTILGGAFTSRLMLNLRERKGFTYGIRSRFGFRTQAGPFLISTAVATEVTAPAVTEAMAELLNLVEEGPTPGEVSQSRDFIAGVFPLRLETTGQVAARIGELLVYGLPADFFSTYRDEIRAVTPSRCLEAGQAVLNPEEMVILVVGDGEAVRGPLEEVGLGTVEVVES